MPSTLRMSPIEQAERARQVVGVLGRIEDRIVAEILAAERRSPPARCTRLVTAIDEVTAGARPGVADGTTRELAARLPAPFRGLGRRRPGAALVLYGQVVRDPCRVLQLVRSTHRDLGGAPRHPSTRHRRAPVV